MGKLQQTLIAEIHKVPDVLLRQLLSKKLEDLGVAPDDALLDRFAECIRNNDTSFVWDSPEDRNLTISFGEDDYASLKKASDNFAEQMPEIIKSMSVSAARDMLRAYKKDWREYRPYDDAIYGQFCENLYARWGKGLDSLRLLLALSRDIGEAYHKRLQRSKAKKGLLARDVLARLHIRACQVASEIIALIEGGYADGAMARWRTLFEISVVATLIADNGDDLAERYIEHEAVEAKRAMDEFIQSHAALGYAPPSKRDIDAVNRRFEAAIDRFGKPFGNAHGWAVGYLGTNNPNPKFSDLEKAVGRKAMRSYYKMASYNVHASPKGLMFRLATLGDPGLLIAGASNAGLEEPGQNTAFTLTQITALLFGPRHNLDSLANMQALTMLRDETSAAFVRAARKLRRDDMAVRKEEAARKRRKSAKA